MMINIPQPVTFIIIEDGNTAKFRKEWLKASPPDNVFGILEIVSAMGVGQLTGQKRAANKKLKETEHLKSNLN